MDARPRKELEDALKAVCEEIRNYPTPIARCDLHLPALLEERAALHAKLEAIDAQAGCSPDAVWTNDGGARP